MSDRLWFAADFKLVIPDELNEITGGDLCGLSEIYFYGDWSQEDQIGRAHV